ncbi:hypothetical protein [Ruegeria profundi]|uniref:hypothetical protein n=1 Tax=Ruegeria profundi TaxID=1685378 RepID=UPI001CD7A202|nr:hypothetical protein [Ruegeria profundi]MCA0930173.1 hypothetical protein [Ruegeria profundi]
MKSAGFVAGLSLLAILGACASTSTTQLVSNIVRIDASAAPACGASGARKLVTKMAAVETIRLGYDKYYIAGMDAQNNVRAIGANYNTTGTVSTFGNTASYSGYTTSTPIIGGSQDAAIVAVMFKASDPEAANAIDARAALGPEWQAIVANGSPNTCLE